MAKVKKEATGSTHYALTNTKSEIDILLVLWYAMQSKDIKVIKQVCARLRAKLAHRFPQRIFTNIIEAKDPFLVIDTVIENYLAKPPADEIDLTQHGVCQVMTFDADGYTNDYIHVHFGDDRVDILTARQYEVPVMETCAIQAVQELGFRKATVNVTLFKDHGFSGTTHQFEIGSDPLPEPAPAIVVQPKKRIKPEPLEGSPEAEYSAIQAEYIMASGRGAGLLARLEPEHLASLDLPEDHLDAFYRTPAAEYGVIVSEQGI